MVISSGEYKDQIVLFMNLELGLTPSAGICKDTYNTQDGM